MIAKETLRTLADEKFRKIAEDFEKRIDEKLVKIYTMGWCRLRVHSNEFGYGYSKDIDDVYCESPVVLEEIIEKYRAAGYKIIKCGRGKYDIYVDDEVYEEHMKELEQEELENLKAEKPSKKSFWHRRRINDIQRGK